MLGRIGVVALLVSFEARFEQSAGHVVAVFDAEVEGRARFEGWASVHHYTHSLEVLEKGLVQHHVGLASAYD